MTTINAIDQQSILSTVSKDSLHATVQNLSSFHSRNTLSPGLAEACAWIENEYRALPGMKVEVMKYIAKKGRRIPADKEVVQVIATLPGETDHRVIIGGHIDSLNLSGAGGQDDFEKLIANRAPGANDDASGVAVALEAAKAMVGKKWRNTLVFVAFSGEEQGLLGSTALAERAKAENWTIDALLSNDTVGSSGNKAGQKDTKHVRIFSEEAATHQSRELARWIEFIGRTHLKGFGADLVFRKDRFGRGGDHTPFNNQGFTAVRFVEKHEEYSRQHTPDDLIEFIDFNYLANVAKLNLVVLTELAQATPQPTNVKVVLDQSHDTTLTWVSSPGVKYKLYWRETAQPTWKEALDVGEVSRFTVKKVNKDDHIFAIATEHGIPVLAH